jgi:hypothetical protein
VLGVPGWWPANDDLDFYEDKTVFRAPAVPPVELYINHDTTHRSG